MKKQQKWVFGTFAPLHQGHIPDQIQAEAVSDRSGSRVRIWGRPRRAGRLKSSKTISLYQRHSWWRVTSVCKLDETNLPRYWAGNLRLDQILAGDFLYEP